MLGIVGLLVWIVGLLLLGIVGLLLLVVVRLLLVQLLLGLLQGCWVRWWVGCSLVVGRLLELRLTILYCGVARSVTRS